MKPRDRRCKSVWADAGGQTLELEVGNGYSKRALGVSEAVVWAVCGVGKGGGGGHSAGASGGAKGRFKIIVHTRIIHTFTFIQKYIFTQSIPLPCHGAQHQTQSKSTPRATISARAPAQSARSAARRSESGPAAARGPGRREDRVRE